VREILTNAQTILVKQLSAEIIQHQEDYYNGTPTISDAEYDAKEAQLRALDPNDVALKSVGKSKSNGPRIEHARPMRSIENYYTEETFVEATKSYGADLLEEPKRDGVSCEITYIDGTLIRAVSRGDGEGGEDMTIQVKACKKIPQTIITKIHDLRVRGELVMCNSELVRINATGGKQYANTRNLVAGTLKQKDLSIVRTREIILLPWDMYSPTEDNLLPDSSFERMQLAHKFGFPAYEGDRVNRQNTGDIIKVLKNILAKNDASDITADGVVIKVDSHKLRNTLGVGSKFTNYQHCFKPQNLSSTTELLGIEYGLGRTGKVTPVALLKPVNLGGAMIARATLCNETYMEALGLSIGCTVKILRSGDVIPFIVGLTKPGTQKIVFPTHCPSCKTKLSFDTTEEIIQRFCPNNFCGGKAAKQFKYIGNRETLEIDNLGDSMAEELVSHNINSISDLFFFRNSVAANPLSLEKAYNFRSNVNVRKMVLSLETAKTANWDRWIASLNIPNIGHSLGEDIAKALNLGSEDMKNLPALLLTLPKLKLEKLGKVKTAGVIGWAKDKDSVRLCENLYKAGVRPTALVAKKVATGAALAGMVICMTGELSMGTRKEVGIKLEALGAQIVDDVKSDCNLVIVGDKPGSKLAKAQKKGVKIVDDAWVRKALGL
jgi:DNA ligase (NAD+)